MHTPLGRKLLRLLPEQLGVAICHWECSRPPMAKITPVEQAALVSASPLRYGAGDRNLAWSWGQGPLVVLVHGWGGRAAQMSPLAAHLASIGYRAVAPDITGHGESRTRYTTWPHFFNDLAALEHALGERVHAYVGHSIGGLAMMAARHITGTRAACYVCVCAPSHPQRRIETLQRRLDPSPQALARYKGFIASQFQAPSWEALEAGSAYAGCGPETMLVHDLHDRFMSHEEGDKVLAAHPRVVLKKIQADGHNRILSNPGFLALVGDFVSKCQRTALTPCEAC
jgi:pimeloyl-ACP methyl ester carboxylesterase